MTTSASSRRHCRPAAVASAATPAEWPTRYRDAEIGEVPHRRECAVDRLVLEHYARARLQREHVLPHRGARLERKDLGGVVGEPCGDHRVEGASCSLADDLRGERVAAEHPLERCIPRHMRDPHRQRELVTLRAARVTLAVPALGEVRELGPYGGGEAQPVAQHLPDLAESGDEPLELLARLRELAHGRSGAYRLRATRRGQGAHDPCHRLCSGPESRRSRVCRQRILTTEELGGGLGARGAAHMEQQARVVRLRRGLGVHAQTLAQPHREQRALEAVLERHADAEVGRQGQRRDDLRGADLLAARRRLVRHDETVPDATWPVLTCDCLVTYHGAVTDDDRVFKALADPTRRFLLDLLFARDGRTLTELESGLEMTRFGVMKHLRVLEDASLVVARRSGREKLHFLNPVPIRLIHDRWIDKYTARQAAALADLKTELEATA